MKSVQTQPRSLSYMGVQSYVALQEPFFSRRQHEGETIAFSLALMGLMTSVKQRTPGGLPNAEVLLRDEFVEHVVDGSLRRELKRFARRQPAATLLEVRVRQSDGNERAYLEVLGVVAILSLLSSVLSVWSRAVAK